jgi:hypothetical protein
MRNEILASKQKDERYVPLTCRRYDGKRGRSREKSQASSILCGKKRDPAETGVRKWAGGPSRQGNPGRGRASSSARALRRTERWPCRGGGRRWRGFSSRGGKLGETLLDLSQIQQGRVFAAHHEADACGDQIHDDGPIAIQPIESNKGLVWQKTQRGLPGHAHAEASGCVRTRP